MISLILGPDVSMVREATRRRARASDPDAQETTTLDGKSVSIGDVLTAVASVGFFSAGRTVIVEDLISRFGKQGSKTAPAEWEALFSGVPQASHLILAEPSLASVPAMVKKVLPSGAEVVTSDPPRGRDLVAWIQDRAKSQGGRIEQGTARLLASTLFPAGWSEKSRNPAYDRPPDMETLGNEVDKLVIAAHPNPVTEREIRTLVAAGENDQIFAFIDAASSGNVGRAVRELDALLAAGEDPHRIWSQLAGNLELAAVMVAAGRRDPAEVGRELKLPNPARMTAIARGVREQPRGLATKAVGMVAEADRKLKTGEYRSIEDVLYAVITGIGEAARRQ